MIICALFNAYLCTRIVKCYEIIITKKAMTCEMSNPTKAKLNVGFSE